MSADIEMQMVGHVAVVELCRPPNNYFDTALIAALADCLERLDAEAECRVVMLAARGRHFCAGANFGGGSDKREFGGAALYAEGQRLFRTGKPIVAAVQGAAIGGGLGLAMAADFRVATPEARFAANFTAIGYHPGFGLTVTLPRTIGVQAASLLLATGRRIDGEEAARIGLVDRLAPADKLREAALEFAGELASVAPLALQATRKTLRAGLAEQVTAACAVELEQQIRLRATRDFAEGIAASAERRPPQFRGS